MLVMKVECGPYVERQVQTEDVRLCEELIEGDVLRSSSHFLAKWSSVVVDAFHALPETH